MTELTLFGHQDSGHACKVALGLSLAGLEFETRWIDIWGPRASRPQDFLDVSPLGEVPVLLIDEEPYFQSGAILLEIGTRFQCLGVEKPGGLRRAREILLWEANRIGMCVPQLKEANRVKNEGFTTSVIEWLRGRYEIDRANFDVLLGEADFLHGDDPGIADCAVWGYAQWLKEAGLETTDRMADWLSRMRSLPAMKAPEAFFSKN